MRNEEELVQTIMRQILKKPKEISLYTDCFDAIRLLGSQHIEKGHYYGAQLVVLTRKCMNSNLTNLQIIDKLHPLLEKELLYMAPVDLDSFCMYMEWNREPKDRFYLPRRPVLKALVNDLQRLHDNELDILAISMPPGTGKTGLALFTLAWWGGGLPKSPILTASHNTDFIKGAYKELLRILEPDGEYRFADVFPDSKITGCDAKSFNIDLFNEKRFTTYQFTTVGSGNAGKLRAESLLYCDDLVSGIEEAMSEDRLSKLWQTYNTDLLQRKISKRGNTCKELHIATRWSVRDVIGRLQNIHTNDPRAKFINVPALDKNGESNFDYKMVTGYTTKTLMDIKSTMDDVSWRALYMGQPIEREGLLYHPDELRRYMDLPDKEPDGIFAVCDTKDKGADYACLPVAYKYGEDYYIEDVVCDNGKPEIIDLKLIDILLRNKVNICQFESNSAGGRVAQTVAAGVKEKGGHTSVSTKFTTANKETKIVVNSPWVKEHCLFKDETQYGVQSDYGVFMSLICSYSMQGKNAHDDAPDALAMLAEYIQNFEGSQIKILQRPF